MDIYALLRAKYHPLLHGLKMVPDSPDMLEIYQTRLKRMDRSFCQDICRFKQSVEVPFCNAKIPFYKLLKFRRLFDLVAIEMEEIIKRYNRNTNLAINTKIVLCLYYESAGMSIFYNP